MTGNKVILMSDIDGVCVVTHPLSGAGENATRSLLEILSATTNTSLVTADLPGDSVIRKKHEFVEISSKDVGENVVIAAVRFAVNQVRMCREILRRDEEVILFFGATSYLLPILFAKLIGRTVVLQPRGDVPLTLRLQWENKLPRFLARLLAGSVRFLENVSYHLSDAIITYTPSMANELGLQRFGDKLYTNGARYVDTDLFSITTPLEERDKNVGFLGRIDQEKRIEELAEVAKKLPDDVKFVFIGDGDLKKWLENQLTNEIAEGEAEITGWVDHDEVPEQLNRLKLLVLPSRPTEGLPTVILESLACGTPVYASPVSGVPDVIRDGETGYLIDSFEPEELASEIEEALDSAELPRISSNGRQLVLEDYTLEAAVERYRSMLEKITR